MTMLDDAPVDDLDRLSPWTRAALAPAAEVGRWRLAARLARREIRRRPWRLLLVVLLIGVPVAGLVVGDAAMRTDQLPQDHTAWFGAAQARLTVNARDEWLDISTLDLPAGAAFVEGWEVGYLPLRRADRPEQAVPATVITMDLAHPLARGLATVSSGRFPESADEVFVDSGVAADLGVVVGDTLTLLRPAQSFEVVGVGRSGGSIVAAPGFDVSVLRPTSRTQIALLDGVNGWSPTTPNVADFETIGGGPTPISSEDGYVSVEYPLVSTPDRMELFLGWLFGVMLMSVLGIIVAAAFAVSGRRQLVTIGQLSASGTDPAVLRRYLALQGTWSGAVGAGVGVAGGLGLVSALHDRFQQSGRVAINGGDIAVIALTAIVVATVAAIVPTKQLASTSVLTALGGRRPVAAVRPRQVGIGAMLLCGGLVSLWIAVSAAREANNSGGGLGAAAVLAAVGGLAVLAGTVCVCPAVVDLIARLGARRRGAVRLATRSLGRHRARSAALVAAVASIGGAAMAIGATAEQEFANQKTWGWTGQSLDEVEVGVSSLSWTEDAATGELYFEEVPSGQPVTQDLRDEVASIVGPVEWIETTQVTEVSAGETWYPSQHLVADEALLRYVGATARERELLLTVDAMALNRDPGRGDSESYVSKALGPLRTVYPTTDQLFATWSLVNPAAVERLGLSTAPGPSLGQLDHDITEAEVRAVQQRFSWDNDGYYFRDMSPEELTTRISTAYPSNDHAALTRAIILASVLLLTVIVVSVGMALWAAEGKDERDALVSIGAPPSVLARVAALKAWMIALVGGLIAVPLGFATLRLAVAAAHESTKFPWVVAGALVIVIPALIGSAGWIGSALIQRVRPVKMSTFAAE